LLGTHLFPGRVRGEAWQNRWKGGSRQETKGEIEMARYEASVVINRPVEEVFEFVTNPKNDLLWQSGVLESEQTSEGPMGVGTTLRSVSQSMGRRMEGTWEVIEYKANKKITTKAASGPISAETSLAFEPVEGGTRISLVGEGETGGFFRLAEPIVVRIFQRDLEASLATLKDILEAEAEAST
jgi:carbon monoxide dehydrogenase subunit G